MKKLRILFIAVAGLFFYSVLMLSLARNIYLNRDRGERWGMIAEPIKFMAEIPSLAKQSLEPGEFMVGNSDYKDGVQYFSSTGLNNYPKLLVSFKDEAFGQKFDLIDLQTGKTIKRWEPDNKLLFNKAYNPENPLKPLEGSDLHFNHALFGADSSLIFTAPITSLIVKIDKNSEIIWLRNDQRYHHSLEFDHEGNIYSNTRPFLSKKFDFLPQDYEYYRGVLKDDGIAKIDSNTGDVLFDKSILEILIENGYEELLLSKGQFSSDPLHLNDIQPALTDSEFWDIGDLLVSCRNLNTVFLYRPSTNKIIWLKQGPWYNQHDVDFLEGNKIVVFSNNVIREESMTTPRIIQHHFFFSDKRPHNDVYIYNFEKDSAETPYSQLMKNEDIRTYTGGRCDVLPNGDVFVEDTEHGKIIIGDSIKKKIEYVKRIDDEHISALFWSRLIY